MIKDIENQIETVNRNKDTKIKGISITIIIMILIITMIGNQIGNVNDKMNREC